MSARNLLLTVASLALLVNANTGHAQSSCTLANTPLDTGGVPIDHTRIAFRQDGRPVLAYTTQVHNNSSIYFYDCANATCSDGHFTYLDTSSNYFGASGIVIRADGRPAVAASYFGGLRYYDCADTDCETFTTMDIRIHGSAVLSDTPITLQSNGYPVLLFLDGVPGNLVAHFCSDAGCTAGTEQTLAIPPSTMGAALAQLSVAVGSDGNLAATYLSSEGAINLYDYYIARCSDSACATVTNTQISQAPGSTNASLPNITAVAIRSDQRPLALDSQSNDIALLDCKTSACTAVDNRPLPSAAAGLTVGLGILTGDIPTFSVFNALAVSAFACIDTTCSSGTSVTTATTTTSLLDADFAVGPNARPAITYIDADAGSLAIVACSDTIFKNGFD